MRTFIHTVLSGIYTAYTELLFSLTLILKIAEIKQIQQKIKEEQCFLGQLICEKKDIDSEEVKTTLKQIEFLQEEVEYLKEKLENFKNLFLHKRQQRLKSLKGVF